MELKNPVDENATIASAYKQIQTYKSVIPSLFTYNAICVISDGLEAKAGTISAGFTRFMSWKTSKCDFAKIKNRKFKNQNINSKSSHKPTKIRTKWHHLQCLEKLVSHKSVFYGS